MTIPEDQKGSEAVRKALRDYCIRVIQFLSSSAMDPHLYFEKKLAGDVTVAKSVAELNEILNGMLEWIDEMYGQTSGLSAIDQALSRDGLPTLSLLSAPVTRPAGLVLVRRQILTPDEYRCVTELAGSDSIADSDLRSAKRLLAEYEQP